MVAPATVAATIEVAAFDRQSEPPWFRVTPEYAIQLIAFSPHGIVACTSPTRMEAAMTGAIELPMRVTMPLKAVTMKPSPGNGNRRCDHESASALTAVAREGPTQAG